MRTPTKVLLVILVITLLVPGYIYIMTPVFDYLVQKSTEAKEIADKIIAQAKSRISDQPVHGRTHGYAFSYDHVEFRVGAERGVLYMREGEDFFRERELTIKLDARGVPAEKVYVTVAESRGSSFTRRGYLGGLTEIEMEYKPRGEKLPLSDWTPRRGYDLYIKFSQIKNNLLPGSIDIRFHDKSESYISGTFTAIIIER